MRNRYLRLAVSLAVALLISLLLLGSAGARKPVLRPVVIAKGDIEVNDTLSDHNLAVINIPAAVAPAGALTAIPKGKVAGQHIFPGEFLLPGKVKDAPVVVVRPEDRAFPVPVNLAGAGGIQAGDRVDVLLYTGDKNRGEPGKSRVVVSGVTVLEVLNQQAQALTPKEKNTAGSAAVPAVAVLLVTLDQAHLLHVAANSGTLALARYLPESKPAQVASGGEIR